MKLTGIQVQNYRSISATQTLDLAEGLTVILGPNNEGKSNLLRAVVLAMQCVASLRSPSGRPGGPSKRFRLPPQVYEWETDFPRQLQERDPDGETVLKLQFALANDERVRFKEVCGSSINGDLPLEIRVGTSGAQFKVKKQGRGARTYEQKTQVIAHFISETFTFQYIPALRPSNLSLEVIASLLDRELSLLSDNPEYQEALKTIEKLQQPVLDQLGREVQENMQRLLPSVSAVRIGMPTQDRYRSRLRSPQLVIDDGTATDLEAKGDGIKSLAAISLMRASKAGTGAGDLVVAIEEPESHLHPGAIRQLAMVLQDIANEHQVIITTHSPLMVSRSHIRSNIIVSDSKVSPAQSVDDIRQSLGVQVEDNLASAEHVLLFEGPTDVEIAETVFTATSNAFASLVASGRVVFDCLNGTTNVAYRVQLLQLQIATPVLIVDDDDAGRRSLKKVSDSVPLKHQFTWQRSGYHHTEIEDLIDPDLYWAQAEAELGAKLDRSAFDATDGKWSERIKASLQSSGKPWGESHENNLKRLVARRVKEQPSQAIHRDHLQLVDNIIESLCNVVTSDA